MSRPGPFCEVEALEEQLRQHVMKAKSFEDIKEYYADVDINDPDFALLAMEILISQEPEHFSQVIEDWSKIKTTAEEVSTGDMMDEIPSLKGFFSLDNGISLIGVELGLVKHHPVYAVIYHDGYEFRGYIPSKGNVFNKDSAAAFGLDPKNDAEAYFRDFGKLKNIPDRAAAKSSLEGGYFYPLSFSKIEILKDLKMNIPNIVKSKD